MKRTLLTSALLVAGLGLALPVFAQGGAAGGPQPPAGGPAAGGPAAGPAGGPERHFARMCEDQEARLAGKLAYAEKKLKITDQQRAAWTKFADAARAGLKPIQDICVTFKDAPRPAALPQRLERAEQVMQAHLQQVQTVRPALTDLYAQLTPDQQKQAERLLEQGPGGHRGPMMGRMHHGDRDHDRDGREGHGPRHHGPEKAPAPQEQPKG